MADLYADHNVPLRLVELLCAEGFDTFMARSVGLEGAQDDEHFFFAVQQRRTLLTNNRRDFTLLHNAWVRWFAALMGHGGQVRAENVSVSGFIPALGLAGTPRLVLDHPGIIILPQSIPVEEISQALAEFLATSPQLANEVYGWRRQQGWRRFQTGTKDDWLPYPY